MNKLLLFILVLVAIYWIRRSLGKPRNTSKGASPDGHAKRGDEPEKMVACAECGVHVPESEGVRDESGFYCCAEHRRQHQRG